MLQSATKQVPVYPIKVTLDQHWAQVSLGWGNLGPPYHCWILILCPEISAHILHFIPSSFRKSTRTTQQFHINKGVYRVAADVLDIYNKNATVIIYSEYCNKFFRSLYKKIVLEQFVQILKKVILQKHG